LKNFNKGENKMGLKTTNYEIKKLGVTLPNAYAMVKKLMIDGTSGYAEFVIQSTRDKSVNLSPIDTVRVDFVVDRNESPYVTAYRVAKGQKIVKQLNRETHEYEDTVVNMPFHGWEDDIASV
jgi:hypothetical protein